MKIAFFDDGGRNLGSTRIWICNLCEWLVSIGIQAEINPGSTDYFDVIIFGKTFPVKKIRSIVKSCNNVLFGNINPSDYTADKFEILQLSDFLIVGSLEEKAYYSNYKENVFIFPLIEKIYTKKKKHRDNKPVILGYHGNKMHLEEFYPHIKNAIEEVSKIVPLKMIAIYNVNALGKWRKGRPDIDIEDVQWDIETIENQLIRTDIGLVPTNITLATPTRKLALWMEKIFRPKFGYLNDFLIRFKNTNNAGRAFVFHQLNIPVITDLSPSNFHILGDGECGRVACGKNSWKNAILELAKSHEKRAFIAGNAYNRFIENYDPLNWTQKLVTELHQLQKAHSHEGI